MKKFALILALLVAIGCGALAFSQFQGNAALKQELATLRDSADAQKKLADAELEKLRAQNEIYKNESRDLRQKIAAAPAVVPGPAVASAGSTTAADIAPGATEEKKEGGGDFMKGVAKMFKDPEMKKVMRTQQSMGIRMMYGDLAKELGLSPDEATQVMELLTDRQMAVSVQAMDAIGGDADPAKTEEAGKAVAASRDEYDQQLKSVLGDAKMAKLNDYERTVGDRMQLQQVQQSLSASGISIDDKQKQGLLGIMKEERLKTPPSPFDPGNKDVGAQMKAMQSEGAVEQLLTNSEDFNRRVLNRANTVLSPDQINGFETAQKQQLEMMKMGVKMSSAMFKKPANPPPPTPVPTEVK